MPPSVPSYNESNAHKRKLAWQQVLSEGKKKNNNKTTPDDVATAKDVLQTHYDENAAQQRSARLCGQAAEEDVVTWRSIRRAQQYHREEQLHSAKRELRKLHVQEEKLEERRQEERRQEQIERQRQQQLLQQRKEEQARQLELEMAAPPRQIQQHIPPPVVVAYVPPPLPRAIPPKPEQPTRKKRRKRKNKKPPAWYVSAYESFLDATDACCARDGDKDELLI